MQGTTTTALPTDVVVEPSTGEIGLKEAADAATGDAVPLESTEDLRAFFLSLLNVKPRARKAPRRISARPKPETKKTFDVCAPSGNFKVKTETIPTKPRADAAQQITIDVIVPKAQATVVDETMTTLEEETVSTSRPLRSRATGPTGKIKMEQKLIAPKPRADVAQPIAIDAIVPKAQARIKKGTTTGSTGRTKMETKMTTPEHDILESMLHFVGLLYIPLQWLYDLVVAMDSPKEVRAFFLLLLLGKPGASRKT